MIDARVLGRWTTHLHEHGGRRGRLSPRSIASYVDAINFWLKWAHRQGEAAEVQAHRPRQPKRLLAVLSLEEVERISDAAQTERDRLIVQILWQTGCRASELLGLRVSDLVQQGRRRYLTVLGPWRQEPGGAKANRERLVPIPQLWQPLRQYIDRRRPRDTDSTRIWLSRYRSPQTGLYEQLELSGLEQMVRNLASDAGLGRRVHPQLFRHSAGTQMLRSGMNPLLVAQILGHSSLAMLHRTYAHLDQSDAYEAMARLLTKG
jgi:integrase/recombinase XerD